MSRYLVLAILILSIVGCGQSPQGTNMPSKMDAGAVTYDKPTEEKSGTTTMKELCEKAGLKIYPGSEAATGVVYKRGDGGAKDEVTFTTSDSIEKVASFFKDEGLDTSVPAAPIGQTSKGAQIMVSVKTVEGKSEVTIKSLRYEPKGP